MRILIGLGLVFCLPVLAVYKSATVPTIGQATGAIYAISAGVTPDTTSWNLMTRIHTPTAWAAEVAQRPINVGGYKIRFDGSGATMNIFFEFVDSTASNCNSSPIVVGAGIDISFLIVRDIAGLAIHTKVVNTQTAATIGTCDEVISTPATGNAIRAQGIVLPEFNGIGSDVNVAYIRWCSGAVAIATPIPAAIAGTCDLGDWKFENNGNDDSGHAQAITGIATYITTPTYAPSVDAGTRQTFNRTTGTGTLSGSCIPLDGSTTVTYAWTYNGTGLDGVTQTPAITSPAAASTGVTGLTLFGSANFKLTCTDSSAVASNAVVHDGVVTFNASTKVVGLAADGRTAAQITIVGGTLSAMGQNSWPFADTAVLTELAQQRVWLADTSVYGPWWRTFATGTVAFTGASTTVTGTTTAFNALFCDGLPGPFVIDTSNRTLVISVDGGAGQTVTFTTGTRTVAQLLTDITAQTTGLTTSTVNGGIRLTSNTTGTGSSIGFGSAGTANTILRLPYATFSGSIGVSGYAPTYLPDSQMQAPYLAWRYTGTDGATRYTMLKVKQCNSNTSLNLVYPDGGTTTFTYPSSPAAPWPANPSGLSFRRVDYDVSGFSAYADNSAAGPYYDSVEFGKRVYWQSGFDDAWDYANTWATYWREYPGLDGFFNILDTNHGAAISPGPVRSLAAEGMILHEQDGHSELLPGLRGVWAYVHNLLLVAASTSPITLGRVYDMRENAYEQAYLADCALIESGASLDSCRADLVTALDSIWTPLRDGTLQGWRQFYADTGAAYSSITTLSGQGTVSATAGNPTLTGTGTAWDASIAGRPIWLFSSTATALPASNASGDAAQYFVTAVNVGAQTLTLSSNYGGTTAGGKGFVTGINSRLAAWGFQPFMQGLLAKAFFLSKAASTAAGDTARATTYGNYGHDAIQLVATQTRTPDRGGLYYGFGYPGCSGSMTSASTLPIALCYGADGSFNFGTGAPYYGFAVYTAPQLRFQSLDVMQAICMDYQATLSAATRILGDALMSEMFSKPGSGGPTDDANYLSDFALPTGFWVSGSFGATSTGSKPANQLNGFTGAASCWSASRTTYTDPTRITNIGKTRATGKTVLR